MLNTFARFLLVWTSIAPVLGAVAVNEVSNHEHWSRWGAWLASAFLLVFLCWAMLRYREATIRRFRIVRQDGGGQVAADVEYSRSQRIARSTIRRFRTVRPELGRLRRA
jgi:peptidoglycan/LPS O-acetylase OafA/YrhL